MIYLIQIGPSDNAWPRGTISYLLHQFCGLFQKSITISYRLISSLFILEIINPFK